MNHKNDFLPRDSTPCDIRYVVSNCEVINDGEGLLFAIFMQDFILLICKDYRLNINLDLNISM